MGQNNLLATKKQLEFIEAICDTLNITFYGTTKKEAIYFIDKNIKEFNERQECKWALEHGY
jgi:hypothetical protein